MSRSHEEEQNDHECELAAWELLREAKAKIEELKTQLGDAKATTDLWIQKAKQADEAAADLKADLAETKRHWKEETEEQARLLGMSAERECDLRGKLERERANTIHTCHDQCQKPMCVMRRERDEARQEIESIKKLLLDPNAVRINMLHGKIAKLDWEKLEHIHGPHPARDQLAAERALADRLAEAFNDLWDNHTMYGAGYEVVEKALAAWKEARSE